MSVTFDQLVAFTNQVCSTLPSQLDAIPLVGLLAGSIARIVCTVASAVLAGGPEFLAALGVHF
ncbi:MAG: hypothetical protein U1A27_04495 [Phycisphaerae bacterium]